ncbi:glutamate racemase [Alicyclobacillus tolerans]|uniref:glutamate racemase n=1 Tax=Alicyclobacillus tolerans TaxID=90970 RepID=UPI001F026DDE|nr:glutamate racemase [Alicyclobacillus tolerans]MCF8563516.1 glutamate racemase [Alicyclobacillus tolerans]
MSNHRPIGVFDSGIGGLTVAAAIAAELPNEQIFYFGDTARCPYGDRDPAEVAEFSIEVLDFLYAQGVKLLVVACNTATAVALPILEKRYKVPVIGVIQPGSRAAAKTTNHKRIGVIGTAVTIHTGAYERAVKSLDPNANVHSLACPAFVPLVESGQWSGPDVEKTVLQSLLPLMEERVDTLILGCTHYPLLQETIQQVVGNDVRLISSAYETAVEVRAVLTARNELREQTGHVQNRYYTSGDGTKMRAALQHWLNLSDDRAEVLTVPIPASSPIDAAL